MPNQVGCTADAKSKAAALATDQPLLLAFDELAQALNTSVPVRLHNSLCFEVVRSLIDGAPSSDANPTSPCETIGSAAVDVGSPSYLADAAEAPRHDTVTHARARPHTDMHTPTRVLTRWHPDVDSDGCDPAGARARCAAPAHADMAACATRLALTRTYGGPHILACIPLRARGVE